MFILITSYVILDYHFEKVILYFLNLHVLGQYFINHYIFSSIKETNWLINKGMRALLFDVFIHLLLRKTDVLKICPKSKFIGKKIWRNALALKRHDLFGIITFSCLSSTRSCFRFLLSCFVREIKGFYQSSLGNEVDFKDIMNVSPNIFAKN